MRMNPRFIVGVVAFLALVFAAQWQLPRRYSWTPTFLGDDKQPFGCYVVDSLLKISVPQGYSVTDSTLYQLDGMIGEQPCGIIVVANYLTMTNTDMKALRSLLKKGCHVMILTGNTPVLFDDSLGVGTYGGTQFNIAQVKQIIKNGYDRDSVKWVGRPKLYPNHVYRILPQLVSGELTTDDKLKYHTLYSKWTENWVNDSTTEWVEEPAAIAVKQGKGRLIVGCDPLLFTNYTVLDGDNCHLLFRMVSEMDSLPILRTEAYLNKDEAGGESPLRFFLSTPALRWMVWLTVSGLLLFFLCTSRRRQRVIPVIVPPSNKSMEFVKLIGTLYHQWLDNKDLVRKKYVFFAR